MRIRINPYYKNQTTTVEKRHKPVAEVGPVGGRKAMDGQKRLAQTLDLTEEEVLGLLAAAFRDEDTKSLIQEKCVVLKKAGDGSLRDQG